MGPAKYPHTFGGCSTFMKRNCSASVWLLLTLVVVLFCLSAAAPREWSSWDSRPLGHAAEAAAGRCYASRANRSDGPRF